MCGRKERQPQTVPLFTPAFSIPTPWLNWKQKCWISESLGAIIRTCTVVHGYVIVYKPQRPRSENQLEHLDQAGRDQTSISPTYRSWSHVSGWRCTSPPHHAAWHKGCTVQCPWTVYEDRPAPFSPPAPGQARQLHYSPGRGRYGGRRRAGTVIGSMPACPRRVCIKTPLTAAPSDLGRWSVFLSLQFHFQVLQVGCSPVHTRDEPGPILDSVLSLAIISIHWQASGELWGATDRPTLLNNHFERFSPYSILL